MFGFLGAFLYSLRGGLISRLVGFNLGTFKARLSWILPSALVLGLTYWNIFIGIISIFSLYSTLMIPHRIISKS